MLLEDLGKKTCIIGPGSGGKSKLAQALGETLQMNVCHLNRIAYAP